MKIQLEILPVHLLEQFCVNVDDRLELCFDELQDSELSIDTFNFYVSISAVFSSKIEGVAIELDSYIKHKRLGAHFLPDYTRKTDDLYDAYLYAKQNVLTEKAALKAHSFVTRHILQKAQQGRYRIGNMFVVTTEGKIEYVAAAPELVKSETKLFFADIKKLLSTKLNFKEVLYFAALIHLVFVKIHPFEDGNGRTARLLEKWFLAQKLGENAWYVQSEKYYYSQHEIYYNNIRCIGLEYESLDYTKALPFLLLLSESIVKQ